MNWRLPALLLIAGCGGPPTPTEAPSKALIRVGGSDTITSNLMPRVKEAFERNHPDIEITIRGGGSQTGIRGILDQELDLAATSRNVMPAEQEQAAANGWDLASRRQIIAVDVVAVAVHPSNPIDSLTYDQVIGIFCTQTIKNWQVFGQEDAPINALSRLPRSGTRHLFEDFFCGPKGMHPRIAVAPSLDDVAKTLAEDPHAISFITLSESDGKKIIGLRPEPAGEPIRPSQQNIIRGRYPLYHDLYLFSGPNASPEVLKLQHWISSPAGQEVIDEARFVPLFLRPEQLDSPRPLRETIHFDPRSSRPNQRSMARLQLLEEELRSRAGENRHIILEGYTDNQEDQSLELSQERAETVRDMIAKVVPGLYFEIIPRGKQNPIAPNETPYGRQRNRRVQIYFAEEEKTDDDQAG